MIRVHSEAGTAPNQLHVISSDGNFFKGMEFKLHLDDEGHRISLDTLESTIKDDALVETNHHYVGRITAIDITFETE